MDSYVIERLGRVLFGGKLGLDAMLDFAEFVGGVVVDCLVWDGSVLRVNS